MSLALSTLIYEWRRYMAAVIALAFSGVLVLAQFGMFLGIGKAFTAEIDRAGADLMILSPKAEGLDGPAGVPRRIMPQIYLHPEVVKVADLASSGGRFQNVPAEGKPKMEWVRVFAVDTEPDSVTMPVDYPQHIREILREPFAVVVDESSLARLGVKVGDKATINGRTVYVRGTVTGYPNMMQVTVIASRPTMRLLNMTANGPRVGPLFVRIKDPGRVEQVVADLNAISDGRYRAWTKAELAKANEANMFKEQIIGVMLGFSVFLGVLIGVGITWQTLRGAVFGNIKEFASLRALGVSMGSLRVVVLQLSFWVGVAGLAFTGLFMWGVAALATSNGVPMAFNPGAVIGVAIMLMIIAMLSGLLSLGILKKSQPADLLR